MKSALRKTVACAVMTGLSLVVMGCTEDNDKAMMSGAGAKEAGSGQVDPNVQTKFSSNEDYKKQFSTGKSSFQTQKSYPRPR